MLTADLKELIELVENTIRKEFETSIQKVIAEEIAKRDLKMLTINEVAKLIGVGRDTVTALINNGLLPATKIGKPYHISPKALAEFQEYSAGYDLTNERSVQELKKALLAQGKRIRPFK